MNIKKQHWILYFITATIIITIAVQLYWNYKNYTINKQRVTNEIQLSLDNAVEEYYSSIAKNNFITIIENSKIRKAPSKTEKGKINLDNIKITSDKKFSKKEIDSVLNDAKTFASEFSVNLDSSKKNNIIKVFKGKKVADSLKLISNLKPIFISFLEKSINYQKIDSLIQNQLNSKGINLKTSFLHLKKDTLFHQTNNTLLDSKAFYVNSKSTFVKPNEAFQLLYNNPNSEALKRSFTGIFLSFLLSLAIISSLFYLLEIINKQKELAEIKNDLISNITHEFKTPITTVSTAIEAINNFNIIDDKEKTKKYLSISSIQLKKLELMVEKLLETATLDSEKLMLQKEKINLVDFIEKIIKKHQLIIKNKTISFSSNHTIINKKIDSFHFENAISNLIDNAIKYGGDKIEVHLNSILNTIEINIADNGNNIDFSQKEKIFDKFYRITKGNIHDVKGFGIGLYYTKKIIEKHHGTICLQPNIKNTVFKISLPNE